MKYIMYFLLYNDLQSKQPVKVLLFCMRHWLVTDKTSGNHDKHFSDVAFVSHCGILNCHIPCIHNDNDSNSHFIKKVPDYFSFQPRWFH